MSAKKQRISNLIGIRNAINNTEMSADGKCTYDLNLIKQVLATIDATLKMDNIMPMPADSKVEVTRLNKEK